MEKILIFSLCFLLFAKAVYATAIDVKTAEEMKIDMTSLFLDDSSNVLRFSPEFYNTGSIAYKARIRVDILNESDLIFAGWGKEKVLMPGDKENFEIYWFSGSKGNFDFKMKVYFGNEILEYKETDFEVKESVMPEDVFEIREFRTYNDFIIFDLYSKEDVDNVIVIPYKYTPGWIFEQEKLFSMKKNETKLVVIHYFPTVWGPKDLKLAIVSNEGKYYKEETLKLEKKTGVAGFIYYVIDSLKMLLSWRFS